MSGRVGEEVGAEVLLLARVGELGDVLGQLPARVLPGEVRVGLAEADLAQVAHHRALGERLGEEDHVAVARVDLVDQPLPERERLGVRVVDAEHASPRSRPSAARPRSSASHSARQSGGVPVDVVDVLVALGRVLGVLERAVGAAVEPLRVLGQPRVVGRALDREVQRDVDAVRRARPRVSARRSSIVPRSGWTASWPPVGVADRPGRAGIAGRGGQRVVAALAVGQADRVDRRQVEDVEAELGQPRELALDARAGRPRSAGTARTRRRSGRAARSTSIASGGSQRDRAVALGSRSTAASSSSPSATSCLAVSGTPGRSSSRAARARSAPRSRRIAVRARRAASEQHDPLRQLAREVVLAGGDLARELVAPGAEHVGPGLDRVLASGPGRSTANSPAQRTPPRWASIRRISASRQRRSPGAAVADDRAQQLVAVAEDVGRDRRRGRRRSAWPGSARRRPPARVLDHDPVGAGGAGSGRTLGRGAVPAELSRSRR